MATLNERRCVMRFFLAVCLLSFCPAAYGQFTGTTEILSGYQSVILWVTGACGEKQLHGWRESERLLPTPFVGVRGRWDETCGDDRLFGYVDATAEIVTNGIGAGNLLSSDALQTSEAWSHADSTSAAEVAFECFPNFQRPPGWEAHQLQGRFRLSATTSDVDSAYMYGECGRSWIEAIRFDGGWLLIGHMVKNRQDEPIWITVNETFLKSWSFSESVVSEQEVSASAESHAFGVVTGDGHAIIPQHCESEQRVDITWSLQTQPGL